MPKFVDIETPYASKAKEPKVNREELLRNLRYARACVRDSLLMGEIPFASHLFFTQPGILDDNVAKEREMGINAGKDLIEALPEIVTVVYDDLGISPGMKYGIERALKNGRKVEYRCLASNWEKRQIELEKKHSHRRVWMPA